MTLPPPVCITLDTGQLGSESDSFIAFIATLTVHIVIQVSFRHIESHYEGHKMIAGLRHATMPFTSSDDATQATPFQECRHYATNSHFAGHYRLSHWTRRHALATAFRACHTLQLHHAKVETYAI